MRSNSPLLLQRVKKSGSPYPQDFTNPNGRSAPSSSNKAKRYSIEVSGGLKAHTNGNTPVKTSTRVKEEESSEDKKKNQIRSPSKK
jgi:hypothetical protein